MKFVGKDKKNSRIESRAALILCTFFLGITAINLTGCEKEKAPTQLIENLPEVNFDVDYPVGQITKDVRVTQSFISNCNEITSVQLYGATYIRKNTATIQVRVLLTDEVEKTTDDGQQEEETAGWEIAVFRMDSSRMQDNTIVNLVLQEGDNQDPCVLDVDYDASANRNLFGKQCMIEITSPDGEPDQSPTFWMTEEDIYGDGALAIAGFEQYNDLWFQVKGVK